MRLAHILEQVYARPWAITPAGWSAVDRLLQSKLSRSILEHADSVEATGAEWFADQDEPTDFFGDPLPQTNRIGSAAIIPVQGTIGKRVGGLARACGVADVEDISAALSAAVADDSVDRIVLDINSPGGSVWGVPELAEQIRVAADQKRVVSFVDGMAASAAYWLAAGSSYIAATRTSDVGSIGVYSAFLDESRAYQMEGLAVELFKAGRLKGAGIPGTSLSQEMREHIQAEIDQIYAWFTADVRTGRPNVTDETMQGQSFLAGNALERGLIDEVVGSIDDVLTIPPLS